MNKVILIGNLTKDPELTQTTNGISVCRFSIAVSRRFTNSEGERDTDFFNIVVWRTLADNCHKYIKKGSKVAVIGTIQNRSYDAQDGTKKYVTEIVAEEVEFVGSKVTATESEEKEVSTLKPIKDDSDDLPF